ncbi:asparaginase [Paracoccus sp. (in: a-proteobacteria)]|uniref:asparaginase n=1 Tax=Paracoccus sp. TaxID=267 RepID=UPI0026DFC2C2|nr:asparaginase [Paracoccus sp. (in: a-proteobacteria)]MDO5648593.1 asparaginase [Paracoccus sp. (in: a-proteobacteria)]
MKIAILYTGGTIGSVGQPLAPMAPGRFADAARGLLGDALQAAHPGVALHFDDGLRFPGSDTGTLDSTDLRPGDWCRMATHVVDLYSDFDGFVILHGTDTLDFTGAALPLLLNITDANGFGRAVLSKPVILTGSQLPLFRDGPGGLVLNAGSDAFANLSGAIACARLRIPEVAVFFNTRLMRGNRVLKVSTTTFAGFDSPHLPDLAGVGIGAWHGADALPGPVAPDVSLDQNLAPVRAQLEAITARIDAVPVAQIPALPGAMLAVAVRDATASGARVIVMQGFGEGNLPHGSGDLSDALRDADAAGISVVVTSRVIGGVVGAFHYAAGAWVADTGAISGGDMTPVAAATKAMILHATAPHHGWDRATIHALIRRNLHGEMVASDRLTGALLPGQAMQAADGDARLINDPDTGPALFISRAPVWQAGAPGRLQMQASRLTLTAPDGRILWRSQAMPGGVPFLTTTGLHLIDPTHCAAPLPIITEPPC